MRNSTINHNQEENKIFERIAYFISNGGPQIWEYQELDYLIDDVNKMKVAGQIEDSTLDELRSKFGKAFSNETMQGFAYNKPYGYSGDFEIETPISGNMKVQIRNSKTGMPFSDPLEVNDLMQVFPERLCFQKHGKNSVKYVSSGTCYCKYGVSQHIDLEQTPI